MKPLKIMKIEKYTYKLFLDSKAVNVTAMFLSP